MRKVVAAIVALLALVSIAAVAQAATISSWPLALNANDTMDGNNGTAVNVTFAGGAANMTGSSRITVPYNANLSPESRNVTASVEINTTTKPGTGDFDFDLIRSSPTGKMFKVELFPHHGLSQAQCIFIGSTNGTATKITLPGGPSLIDGNWHTITCRKTANLVTLTVDDVQVASASIRIDTIHHKTGAVLAIGYKPTTSTNGADHFIGAIRNVSVAFD
jgi:hypothetical protein